MVLLRYLLNVWTIEDDAEAVRIRQLRFSIQKVMLTPLGKRLSMKVSKTWVFEFRLSEAHLTHRMYWKPICCFLRLSMLSICLFMHYLWVPFYESRLAFAMLAARNTRWMVFISISSTRRSTKYFTRSQNSVPISFQRAMRTISELEHCAFSVNGPRSFKRQGRKIKH